MTTQTVTLADTVGLTDVLSRHTAKTRTFADTVGLTDSLVRQLRGLEHLSDTVGIVGVQGIGVHVQIHPLQDAVGLPAVLALVPNLIQYDTWRPILSPDNQLILACRTPKTEHDTATGFTHMSLWTFKSDGTNENVVLGTPATHGFTSYGHPEWSPDGNNVVIYAEDSTTYKIVVLDTTGYDRPLT